MKVFKELGSKAQRGSKPRCHLVTDGPAEAVAARLTLLAAPFATIRPTDRWMPQGFTDCAEAQLDKADGLLCEAHRIALAKWWLPADRQGAMTPNFDIASTCTIKNQPGLLLIEAKAHAQELRKEAIGRQLPDNASEERKASHPTIGAAIDLAAVGLTAATRQPWHISRDSHYQMSNRFAWSWKLADLGVPVVLVYLGFVHAKEMKGQLVDSAAWNNPVLAHAKDLVPADVWGQALSVKGVPLIPLIRSMLQPLEREPIMGQADRDLR